VTRPTGGTLHLVATPIGNLGDLSPRAAEVLGSVALVCCEDTRRTGTLLRHAGVTAARLAICNEHTEWSRIPEVVDVLSGGDDVALVSDAGTPGISDPGSAWCEPCSTTVTGSRSCPVRRRRWLPSW
jgi:16S rRNA (cytidine1402-2'-O)-methyltransferase